MVIIGWVVWCLACIVFLRFCIDALDRRPVVRMASRMICALLAAGLVLTVVCELSKLHLLWFVPIAFFMCRAIAGAAVSERVEKQCLDQLNGKKIKRFGIKSVTDIRGKSTLPYIIELMMFRDSMLASYRWYRRLEEDDSIEASVDRLSAIVCGAGWAFESMECLRKLRAKGIVTPDIIKGMPRESPVDPQAVWQECFETEPAPPMLKRLKEIRQKCFAHFDLRLARQIIEDVASGEVENVFAEWTEKRNTKSRFTIAWMAVTKHVFGISKQVSDARPTELGEQILKISILLENLIAALVADAGLEFEECQ